MSASSPSVADDLARQSLSLGRALSKASCSESCKGVRHHLDALHSFAVDVRVERWYAPPFLRWVEGFLNLLEEAEVCSPDELGALLEWRVGGMLFDYRLCSYDSAAAFGACPRAHRKGE